MREIPQILKMIVCSKLFDDIFLTIFGPFGIRLTCLFSVKQLRKLNQIVWDFSATFKPILLNYKAKVFVNEGKKWEDSLQCPLGRNLVSPLATAFSGNKKSLRALSPVGSQTYYMSPPLFIAKTKKQQATDKRRKECCKNRGNFWAMAPLYFCVSLA